MQKTAANPEREPLTLAEPDEPVEDAAKSAAARANHIARLRLLWEQRRFLFRVAAYGLLVATLIAFLIPKSYESTTRLMPPNSQSSSSMAMMAALSARTGGLGAFAGDLFGLNSSGALFIGVLRSRTVLDRLVDGFDLKKFYGASLGEDARRKLAENTAISEDRKSGIISITVTDRDPQRAAAIAQAYVEQLDRLVAELSTSAAHRERVFLEQRLEAVKKELDSAARDFSEFASKNIAIDIPEQGRAMVEAAATLQGQLIAAQSQFEGLRQIYTDNNVRVREVRARIDELQRQLEKLGGKVAGPGSNPGQTAGSLYPSIRELPLLGVTYADLYRRTRIQEAVYETLTQQYELAKVQEAKETPSVKVLDRANVPDRKSFPPRLTIMVLGTFMVSVCGAVLILARAGWAEIDSDDSGKILAQEVFATIKANTLGATGNGSHLRGRMNKVLGRLSRKENQLDSTGESPK